MTGGAIYLDTSAAVKLVRPEKHSAALTSWLRRRHDRPVVSSALVEVELPRATRRAAPDRLARADEVLRSIGTVAVTPAVLTQARNYPEPVLRSLDAIHLATAERVALLTREPLAGFVAYDERLLAAARNLGLPAVSPGAT